MNELFEDKGLILEDKWIKIVNELMPIKELNDSKKKITAELIKLVENAIMQRIQGIDHVGIFFSGGLDSSLIAAICKKHKVRFTCYTVGFQDGNMEVPEDIEHAEKVAKFLKLNDYEFKTKIFNLKEAEEIIKKTAKILKGIQENSNINKIVNIGVGSVELAAYSISNKEKFFFSGLGSEELFAGYERHKNNPTNQECFNGLLKMHQRDLLRDSRISESMNFKFLTPFLDKELIEYALRIPIKYKINKEGSKMILRKTALDYLKEYSKRPKKAAQYGSSFDKAISRLAKLNGYKDKISYINSI
ncbi:TPA: hypothetical protein HA235_03110 [Candidatus Woesearchaeota archaeon]|nr:asparagine synthase C-terminal domain-containing protein [Candidatus Woesearchaeota archaeon]HIH31672.1 hypothetical protein [Candidatus Woesearchaeota archaeon]HIH54224.1 hypothetical protein [Candidatus Woesearchaeota archaeon]HIJ02199.1 hypothetical protein [Candidatus Woesearchaeota archaeon]HIJ13928.1 hypothetical protein [Candidatus Woesearchaeota archaeon]